MTGDELQQYVDELLAAADEVVSGLAGRPNIEIKGVDEDRFKVIAALSVETFTSAEATALLVRSELSTNALTTARRAFEHAVTAAWLASDQGSVQAFVREKALRATANLAAASTGSASRPATVRSSPWARATRPRRVP